MEQADLPVENRFSRAFLEITWILINLLKWMQLYLLIYNCGVFSYQKKPNVIKQLGWIRDRMYKKVYKIDRISFRWPNKLNGILFFCDSITI
jgi:hypothetical protein